MTLKASFEDFYVEKSQNLPSTSLHAAALLIEGSEQSVLSLSVDAFFISEALQEYIKQVANEFNEQLEVLVFATHAHSLPNIDLSKHWHWQANENTQSIYKQSIARLLAKLFGATPQPFRLSQAQVPTKELSVYRRKLVWTFKKGWPKKRADFLPNFQTTHDDALTLLAFQDNNHQTIAYLVHWACHPVDYPHQQDPHPDFPHFLRQTLFAHEGKTLPVLFLNGFAGNVRPATRIGTKIARFWKGEHFLPARQKEYIHWVEKLCACLKHALDELKPFPLSNKLTFGHKQLPLEDFFDGSSPCKHLSLAFVNLGGLVFFAASGELMTEHALWLQAQLKQLPNSSNFLLLGAGYEGLCFGYYPTNAMISEGGYEVDGFFPFFGMQGKFQKELDAHLYDTWKKWLQNLLINPHS